MSTQFHATVRLPALVLALLVVVGCANQRPVIYPEGGRGSPAGSERAVEQCMAMAEANGLDYSDGDVAGRTARGGVIGGAGGAAVGAVFGDVGRGAGAGAAHGAATGLFSGLFARGTPDPVYRNFVNRCLRDRGYDPIGWR
ncbi:glycine zipper family protein [Spectribacter hydrogenooxidans]|uniref:Glycine zipper family protein n=1 Tax=Spectribacter hydrogenoxidans TaxID=3075608 RepID=A0ABU3BWW3_9GAMM|nr:glycine zipper family protein [Salinisphaera sp. W335]MDT0633745.1 glycine zipper family protein [Salinisphaera sp. W335]